ncbi:MAG: periplasmic heavy metal sensor [Anaerolineae bacterium]|nr:periplasmic heavy metal sensor [Gloeobacterales cyanobacterium ES-bin-313]
MKYVSKLFMCLWLALAAPALAQVPPPASEPPGLDLTNIGLTPEQRTRIQTIRRDDQQAAAEVRNNLKNETRQLRTLFESDATDDQLRQQYERVASLRQQLDRLRFDNFVRVRSILSTDQRSQVRFRFREKRFPTQAPSPPR